MDERQLGEITGELRGVRDRLTGLDRGLSDLRAENAQDHAAVVQQITTMGERFKKELDKKAAQSDLEDVRDEGRDGIGQLRGWLFMLLIAVASSAIVNFVVNIVLSKGH
jgi:hypothetical protein